MTNDQQPLVDHLAELRTRVIRSLLGILVGFGICWNFSDFMMDWVRRPIQPYLGPAAGGGLVFLGVMDKFVAHIKLAALGGVILSCPFWLYQMWKFVSPGLYQNERKYAVGFIGFGTIMFLIGISFAYFFVYPSAFQFLLGFGGTIDKPMITLDQYLSFFMTTTLVFGLSFELPLVMTILGMLGVIDDQLLRRKRRYAIVILAVISAIITPPDAISMVMLLIPLIFLYEMSIFLVKMFKRQPEPLGTVT
jgi:sec-independent protein translocase protein TatC